MSDTLHSDEENSAETDADENPYADAHGEPLKYNRCGEYVAVHYHPQGEFPAHYAGFVAHCACAAGPQLGADAVEGLPPRWYAEMVQETEDAPESWLDFYLHDHYDAADWVGDDDE